MTAKSLRSLVLSSAAAVLLAAPALAAGTYSARLINDDPREGRKIENLTIEVERMSTPAELAALADGGAEKAAEVGSARLERTRSRAAIAAVETSGADGKKLVLVFEKPLNWFDGSRNPSARKYPYGVLELSLDGDGKGEGKLIAGAQVKFDQGGVAIQSASGEPMRIIQVSNGQS
ncbi:MAG: hypothetical protein KDB94_08645 [Acidobacteria bacterium]|nr:hypothetical protein [Acidobacteriota bacterium]